MVQKTALIFESVKGEKSERTYQFIIPVGAPFGEVFDVAFEVLSAAEDLAKQAMENAKKAMEEAKSKESEPAAQEVVAEVQ
jgi:lysophospholipid acyltransferase (LPLAT)-like uncharacterized protein